MRTIHGIRMLALLWAVCPQAVAQDKTFLEKILSAAEVGNIDAQFRAGSLYATGQGTTKNLTLAFQWWSKAAEQGHTQAQFNVGLMHARRLVPDPASKPAIRRDDSMRVQPSIPLGVKWAALPVDVARQRAVIQGELGQVYDYQKGFFQGFAELPAEASTQALAWWRKAAEKGHA
ncbi:MAG: sel1 repeat family protein [Prosthecobacter sp.]|jgi:TPR repeat protein|uniref:tetratricopeptide repeat protein n=1 Tax=Prosthecobacter sp. TaxID=1965333 RepID=UPI0019FF7F40|nr:tetratricopeptide repeat protein [Prosthecobacter sp.]MBE2282508.1 sel1 repeat family protein [Prosthecobacter sp.]